MNKYIPKHKADYETIESLYQVDEITLSKIAHEVLEWMADFNWPIAKAVKDLVIKRQDSFIEGIKEVLLGVDQEAKYAIIMNVVEDLSKENMKSLEEILGNIYFHPTEQEIESEVWQELKELVDDRKVIPITFKRVLEFNPVDSDDLKKVKYKQMYCDRCYQTLLENVTYYLSVNKDSLFCESCLAEISKNDTVRILDGFEVE